MGECSGLGAKAAIAGERLLAAGELGLARLEFEAALAAPDLPPASCEDVCTQLAVTRARLARLWLEKGYLWTKASADEARVAFELALSLAGDPSMSEEIGAALARLDEEEPTPTSQLKPREGALDISGDEDASALDLALLRFPAHEACAARLLAEADAAIAAALVLASEGDGAGAVERWQAAGEAARAPLARREWARACLLAGDDGEAARLLAEAEPGDDEASELALHLSLAVGRLGEALAAVDVRLEQEPRSQRWWGLRARVCEVLGSTQGLREADERTVEIYLSHYVSDQPENREFPLASVERLGRVLAAEPAPAARARGRALAQLLVVRDPERRAEWRALRRELCD